MPEQRKYSLDEIDRMREAVRALNPIGGPVFYGPDGPSPPARLALDSNARTVEDRLRTYMLGGVGPEELEAKAARGMGVRAGSGGEPGAEGRIQANYEATGYARVGGGSGVA